MIKISKYFIPYILILILIGFRERILISLLVVFFHELTHYLVARYLGFTGFDIEILPIGAVLKLKQIDDASPLEDLIISISAPVVNLILGLFFYNLYVRYNLYAYYIFFQCNLVIGMFNLIPAYPLDGGRILRDILRFRIIYKKANNATIYVSICIGIIFIFYYLFLFFGGKININLGIISLFIIISSLKERERIAYLIMGDIIKKKVKFLKKGYIENKSISIHYKNYLLNVIGLVERNRYNIFIVLDDDMKVIDTVYECEIIDMLKEYGNITVEEMIKNRNVSHKQK